MGPDSEHESAWSLLRDPGIRADDDSGYRPGTSSIFRRLPGKNALPNGAAYAASKWGLNGLTLLGGGRIAGAQSSGIGGLSGLSGNGTQPACGERCRRKCCNRRRGACGCDAGDAGSAIVYQRGIDPADAEAMRPGFGFRASRLSEFRRCRVRVVGLSSFELRSRMARLRGLLIS